MSDKKRLTCHLAWGYDSGSRSGWWRNPFASPRFLRSYSDGPGRCTTYYKKRKRKVILIRAQLCEAATAGPATSVLRCLWYSMLLKLGISVKQRKRLTVVGLTASEVQLLTLRRELHQRSYSSCFHTKQLPLIMTTVSACLWCRWHQSPLWTSQNWIISKFRFITMAHCSLHGHNLLV